MWGRRTLRARSADCALNPSTRTSVPCCCRAPSFTWSAVSTRSLKRSFYFYQSSSLMLRLRAVWRSVWARGSAWSVGRTLAADPLSLSVTHAHAQQRQKQGCTEALVVAGVQVAPITTQRSSGAHQTGRNARAHTHTQTHTVYPLRDSSPCTKSLLAHLSTARSLAVHPSPAERSADASLAPRDTLNPRPLILITSGCHLNSSTGRDGAIWQQRWPQQKRDAAGKASVCVKIPVTRQDGD